MLIYEFTNVEQKLPEDDIARFYMMLRKFNMKIK